MTTFFLAGIIQGSMDGHAIHPQDYRRHIREILRKHVVDAEVYCPIECHPDSLAYEDGHAREVFFGHVERAATSDVLVAFLPEASMGTAVEMWEAHQRGRVVLTVTPMQENWTVKFLSTRMFADLDAFERFVTHGELVRLLQEHTETSG
ncbi:MAG TPA: hypothetical protein VMZ92_02535 [Planctomycetota bacterium]|nr:hypothetical protein [Planctomycetota bacterium]